MAGKKGAKHHGHSKTLTYKSWKSMKSRCNNPTHPDYPHYGARGVIYDSRWEDFLEFLKDMGERPEDKTLDRYPNTRGNYCKDNCRWATAKEQVENRLPSKTYKKSRNNTSGVTGVMWKKDKKYKSGGQWQAVAKRVNNKIITLYMGQDFNMAVEARQFYNEFILGEQ